MKKLMLFICGCLFSMSIFADNSEYHKMDGSIQDTHIYNTIIWAIPYHQNFNFPTMKYYIKPFHCKIWTNYVGDNGFGIKILVASTCKNLQGTYPAYRFIILTKKQPLEYYVKFGVIKNLYQTPYIAMSSYGCSPFDSHCTSKADTTVYETCDLT